MATIRINYDTYLVGARKPRERRCIDFYATSRTAMMIILILLAYLVEAATAQRVLSADIWKPQFAANSTFLDSNETLSKRQLTSILTEKPDRSLYWINITIGSPGQAQALQLDTGSRGLIVPSTSSSICSSTLIPCSVLGSFDSSKSTTFDDTDQSTTEGFGDGGSVTGDWFYDTVHIGSQAVTSQLAVLATSGSVIAEGVLGVGFPASYPTINHNLAAQGVIASNSYSIWLNELSAASGTILFGGLDLAKFVAPLLKMPVVGGTTNADGSVSYDQPTVELSRVATLQGTTSTVQTATVYSENAVLDTGTELTILQKPLADSIIAAMGAQYYPSTATSGGIIIPCSAAGSDRHRLPFLGPSHRSHDQCRYIGACAAGFRSG